MQSSSMMSALFARAENKGVLAVCKKGTETALFSIAKTLIEKL